LEGDRARDARDFERASASYAKHLESYPEDLAIWVQLGHCLKDLHKYDEAEFAYGRALQLSPNDHDILLNFGHLRKLQGRMDEALDYYLDSIRYGDNPHALHEALQLTGKLDSPDASDRDPRILAFKAGSWRFAGLQVFEELTGARLDIKGRPADGAFRGFIEIDLLVGALSMDHADRAGRWSIRDLRFVTASELFARFELGDGAGLQLDLWQWRAAPGGGEARRLASGLGVDSAASILRIRGVDPLMPLLFTLSNTAGQITHTICVPFPSLLDGGMHAAERVVIGLSGNPLEDVRSASVEFLKDWRRRNLTDPNLVKSIRVDCSSALLVERIFDPSVQEWIRNWLKIKLLLDNYDRQVGGVSIEGATETSSASAQDDSSLTLDLPPSALPALSSVVRPALMVPKTEVCSHILALDTRMTTTPGVWAVSVPTGGQGLCPQHRVTLTSAKAPSHGATQMIGNGPVAVFVKPPPAAEPVKPVGLVSDDWKPVWRKSDQQARTEACVVLNIGNPASAMPGAFSALLEQCKNLKAEVAVYSTGGQEFRQDFRAYVKDTVSGDRATFVTIPGGGRLQGLRLAAGKTSARVIFCADQSVAPLHDNAIELLCEYAAQDGIGSVSALLAEPQGGRKVWTGHLLDTSKDVLPSLRFEHWDQQVFDAWTVLPAAYNSLLFTAIPQANLLTMGLGLDSRQTQHEDDALFGLDMIGRKRRNVCINAILGEFLAPAATASGLTLNRRFLGSDDVRGGLRENSLISQKLL
jgi:hypothetical protein